MLIPAVALGRGGHFSSQPSYVSWRFARELRSSVVPCSRSPGVIPARGQAVQGSECVMSCRAAAPQLAKSTCK